MAFMAALESDLRALSAEARRRHPAVKDAAEHAILKLRTLSSPGEIALNEDILRIFLMACEVKSVKLSVIGLSCLQKLISHDAVAPSALRAILSTLKDHAEMADESVQLKTLQTILIIFQSHLLPENEDNMARALGICLRLLEHNRSSDSVHNTAAATFRQAVALIFDNVVRAESLPIGKMSFGNHLSRASSVIDDVSRNISNSKSLEGDIVSGGPSSLRETPTKAGRLGLRLLEDLTALAAGGSATWLRVNSLQRIFALDILEFILSNYVSVFRTLIPYEQVLRHQICSLLMTSLRTNVDPEGEAGEPSFRRLVLRSVAHIIRLYSSTLVTESEVFLNMLVKVTSLDLPLWHRILVLEVLRGFCVEVRTLRVLFQNFDMNPKNTNVVENMVRALARVVSTIQVPDTNEESLAAVAGMFSSKAKGVEWSLDNDASNAAVVVASEAHAITLAVEGLLGVVFTVATLTDEAVDVGELESPRCDDNPPEKCTGKTAMLCLLMVDSMWLTILDALSLILSRSQGEAIILEILKGYQAFTQACGVLRAVEPLNSFLASLCKFTISIPNEAEKKSALQSPGSKRTETSVDQRDSIVLTSKNVQALRTLFNIAHRLHNMLGPSWVLVLETLAALDRAIRSPHASTQEVSTAVPKLTREASGQYSDLNILSSLNSQLFESSALMHITAVKSLLSALHQLSCQCASGPSSSGQTSSQQIGSVSFAVERMTSILVNNLHRVEPLWDQVVGHLLELADNPSPQLRNMALDALDQCICAVLGSDRFQSSMLSRHELDEYQIGSFDTELQSFEHDIISPLTVLYMSTQNLDVRAGSLKILLHVLERHGEKLYYSWPNILEMLRSVANVREKDLIPLGFQCVRIIMNDGLSTIPMQCLDLCIEVTGAYSQQKTDINISLTAVSLLWTATDFIAKGLVDMHDENETEVKHRNNVKQNELGEDVEDESTRRPTTGILLPLKNAIDYEKLSFSVFSMLQTLGADERPEVRNSAIRTLFQTLGSHGQKLSSRMWEKCLANYVFPILDHVTHLAANSSRDEWQGKELGTRGGKSVHMLIHHSRNTAQKQWDETLVLVLGGITRLLRSFFPLLQKLSNFWAGWESLLRFVGNSISNGSKEVAFAAINCLQTTIASQCPKGTLPVHYLKSMLGVYELVLQRPAKYVGSASNKVKQDILHSIGDLYVQGQMMFDKDMYLQLLAILHLAVRHSNSLNDNIEAEFGTVTPVQHTILKIMPLLRPSEHLSSMWSRFLEELLGYLPGYEIPLHEEVELEQANAVNHNLKGAEAASNNITSSLSKGHLVKDSSILLHESQIINSNSPNNSSSSATRNVTVSCLLFGEKLVPILVDLFLAAPEMEKYTVYPDIIRRIGRCMCTRRDNPNGSIWRSAVVGFNHVLIDDLSRTDFQMDNLNRSSRTRLWKEVADAYETFLVSSCGHPSQALSAEVLKADESLEMEVLHILCDKLLKAQIDAPTDILQRLVTTLDRCASRTGSLPVETVGMLPLHCSRFSLTCLQKIFSLCSFTCIDDWHPTRSEVSKILIEILLNRCRSILNQFLINENDLGERQMPVVRIEEMIVVLQELGRLVIHPDTASALHLNPHLKEASRNDADRGGRAHVLVLFPLFCELVITREHRVRQSVQVLLRLVASELGLENTTS